MPGSEKEGGKKEKEEGRGKGKLREGEGEGEGEGGLRWMEGGKGKSFHPYFKSL